MEAVSHPVSAGPQQGHHTTCLADLVQASQHEVHPCMAETEEAGKDALQHSGW